MTLPRGRGLWLTLAVLSLLLVLLAVLQYRWTDEIGRADAERRRAAVQRSARRFAYMLERELERIRDAHSLDPAPAVMDRPNLLSRLRSLEGDENALFVSRVLLASQDASGGATLEACTAEPAGCSPVAWPPSLEPLRERILSREDTPRTHPLFRAGLVLGDPPAIVLPLVDFLQPDQPGQERGWWQLTGALLLELDVERLRERVFPRVAELAFGAPGESEYVLSVVRRADGTVLFASDPEASLGEPRRGDLQHPLPGFSGRRALHAELPPERRVATAGAPAPPPAAVEDAPWLLVVRHRGGSLEASVAAVRRRNLAVGLGVLALLGTAAVVLATGAQRARRLAQQQIEFVAGVTHELNTPLAAIRSAGQNLKDGIVKDPAAVRRYGDMIEREGSRLTRLVAQVLDFAGITSGARAYASEPVSLTRVVEDSLADLRPLLDETGVTVDSRLPQTLPAVHGDAAALRHVVDNLLLNAAKFGAKGGWIGVSAANGNDTVSLRVEDRGPGIPVEERSRVFEPFYRGAAAERNDAPGSGLGLAIVRHVVKAHGGSVRIEGRAEGGAAVVVELPAARETNE